MSPDGLWSIGELAERAGVTVKTVRFYTDRGLLPEARRSTGGHRRYAPEALERIRLIRSLRSLDLPVPEVGRVLDDEDALAGAVEERLREVGSRLTELRWREAALRLVRDCPPGERAERLRLVGAVPVPPVTDHLARFWRRILPPRLPGRLVSSILDAAVPQPPADPTPEQVLAFARLTALTAGAGGPGCPGPERRADAAERPDVLYDGLAEAYALAGAELRAGRRPVPGEALDCFVAAHAGARGARDDPAFRARLAETLALAADPVMSRYWHLAAVLTPAPEPTLGAADAWLRDALTTGTAAGAGWAGHGAPPAATRPRHRGPG